MGIDCGCCNLAVNEIKIDTKKCYDTFQVLLYIGVIVTDGYASHGYFQLGDTTGRTMALTLIFPAMVFTSVWCVHNACVNGTTGWEKTVAWMIFAICFAPLVTLVYMIYVYVDSLKGGEGSKMSSVKVGFVKFIQSILQSYPNAMIQIYTLFHLLEDANNWIRAWHIIALTFTLTSFLTGVLNYYYCRRTGIITWHMENDKDTLPTKNQSDYGSSTNRQENH